MRRPATEIAVFTRNLRIHDNPVLAAAGRADRVLPVFVADPEISVGFSNARRQQLLDSALVDLDASLRQRGAALILLRGDPATEVARLANEYDARAVHLAADVSAYANRREHQLQQALNSHRRRLVVHDGVTTIQPMLELHPAGADHYRVFTPYFRRWQQTPRRQVLRAPRRLRLPEGIDVNQLPQPGPPARAEAGESAARRRMLAWIRDGIDCYLERHDDLGADATSHLSPDLHLGLVSPVELADRANNHPGPGSEAFVRQLAWRDFHHQVLAARPEAAWQDYRPRADAWRQSESELEAWRSGRTGFPLVDAGMRQLAQTGWMHNRARLVVASFLTKTLYQDWRLGAQHFLDQLVDGDLANNNLNWQWVAGTGTDTRPNRVLNPVRQALRYDPRAVYVRRWIPELADIDDPALAHQPWRIPANRRQSLGYPDPIVDLDAARDRFLSHRRV